jgi:hypothetical protein
LESKYVVDNIVNNVMADKALAWIEKQGEHAKFLSKIQIGDKVTRNEYGVLVNLSQLARIAKKDEKYSERQHFERDTKWFDDIAKHFFALGLSASNPITAADKGTAEEIIINLKRVENDYRIDLTKEMEWLRNKVRKGK